MFDRLTRWFANKWPYHGQQVRFSFDGHRITVDVPRAGQTSILVADLHEVGIETTDTGPFVEDVYWLLQSRMDCLRIPQASPVFEELSAYFHSLNNFDWEPCIEAMSCTDCRYFLCWKRPLESA